METLVNEVETKAYTTRTSCRACNSINLIDLFSLGDQFLTDFPPPGREMDGLISPLDLIMCEDCSLVQLRHTVDQTAIYGRPVYWYKSGINNTMRLALEDVVNKAVLVAKPNFEDLIIDIGSNDGTLVSMYPKELNLRKVGFEPSFNVWHESNGIDWFKSYNDYFSYKGHQAKIITSCAMFYDLEDPNQFVRDIYASLAPDGLWIDQQNYLGLMLKNMTFDNISHEHLEYYSFKPFKNLLSKHNLEIIDVEINGVNGGSFRSYIRKVGANVQPLLDADKRIAAIEASETELGLDTVEPYNKFYAHALKIRDRLRDYLISAKNNGKLIYLYGASTRGQCILQFCGLDNTIIKGAAERNPDKYGLMTVGTAIPIMSEDVARTANPDIMLVLPYSFKEEFIVREKIYLSRGGELVFPMPEVTIVTQNSEITI